MKKVFALGILFIFMLWGAYAQDIAAKTVEKSIIRLDSTTLSEGLAEVDKDTALEITGEKYDWYKVRLPKGNKAFVYAPYIDLMDDHQGVSKADQLNVRLKPGLKAPVIGSIDKGAKVGIIERTGDWYEIEAYPYGWGWIKKESVEAVKEAGLVQSKEAEGDEFAEDKPLACGILREYKKLFSPINFKLENDQGTIFLRVKDEQKAREFLDKPVNIWTGSLKKDYLEVERIELAE